MDTCTFHSAWYTPSAFDFFFFSSSIKRPSNVNYHPHATSYFQLASACYDSDTPPNPPSNQERRYGEDHTPSQIDLTMDLGSPCTILSLSTPSPKRRRDDEDTMPNVLGSSLFPKPPSPPHWPSYKRMRKDGYTL
ncbi:hypothetical protein D9758_007950 [Tetrapyrgos nigripes]|uniref:Uncharacterized protein n=1 Tax=Tetrapyrgos nigripes TaxID=182062 RepID=A0A8H5FXM0_9AGAR|nr:hypothetical protein D9758_007950 [Tetrapyrgos nigripes]